MNTKIKIKFSLLPTKLENGKITWLNYYCEEWVYGEQQKCISLPLGLPWNKKYEQNDKYSINGRTLIYNTESWYIKRKFKL